MKKVLCLLLTLGFLFPTVGDVFARTDEDGINPSSSYVEISTYVFVKDHTTNKSGSLFGDDQPTARAVSVGTIGPNDRIVGITLTVNSPDKGAVCSLYDLDTIAASSDGMSVHDNAENQMTNSNLIVEVEVGADPGSTTLWFPYPMKVAVQLGIMIGELNAAVTIYYIDV